ncbi:hypothetical protein V2J09_024155 [Rumex salicifolius]
MARNRSNAPPVLHIMSSWMSGTTGSKECLKPCQATSDCSDDEISSNISREEGLECQICCESFNIVENVPYVLWCGHTLCKNCILGLPWANVKLPTCPIQLPLLVSCPWCNLLSFRLIYKGTLRFPKKNYFLLWMVEGMNGDRVKKSLSTLSTDHQPVCPSTSNSLMGSQFTNRNRRNPHSDGSHPSGSSHNHNLLNGSMPMESLASSLKKFLALFVHMTAKFPLILIFLLIVLYAIPASAAILAVYILISILFALPSFLILYFAYPSLDWLVREIAAP